MTDVFVEQPLASPKSANNFDLLCVCVCVFEEEEEEMAEMK